MRAKHETDTLTATQRIAAELLGRGMRQREVARRMGVHECTVYRWSKREDFRRAQGDASGGLISQMKAAALDVLAQQLMDEDKKIAQQAASQVLKLSEEETQGKSKEQEWAVRFLYAPEPGEAEKAGNGRD